jgi:hypothetical protein
MNGQKRSFAVFYDEIFLILKGIEFIFIILEEVKYVFKVMSVFFGFFSIIVFIMIYNQINK